MNQKQHKPRSTIISDAEFRQIWTQSRSITEVIERTGYSRDSAVRRGSKMQLPRFGYASVQATQQIQLERWQWQSNHEPLTASQNNHAAFAAGMIDAAGKFETVRVQGKILGHRLVVAAPKAAAEALTLLCNTYGGTVAPPLLGPGVRSATSVAWTIETTELAALAMAVQYVTMRWRDEMYAVALFYQNSERK